MNFQVFGCPNCEQPFQVSAAQAGQVVQCPSCAQQVEIPQDAFGEAPPPTSPSPEPHQIFACPTCNGQFGITPEMLGQQVGCPHCQSNILIQMPEPDPEILPPEIDTDRSISKATKKKQSARKSKPPNPEVSKDLFAPGFKGKPKSVKPDLPGAKGDKASPADSQQPAANMEPKPPVTGDDPGTEKEKQRWRSPKKLPPSTESKPTGKPRQKPVARKPETVAPKPRKQKFRQPPTPNDDSKTKRLAFDATVELDDHPEQDPESRSTATPSSVVEAEVVEATVAETTEAKRETRTIPVDQDPATDPPTPGQDEADRKIGDPGTGADAPESAVAIEAEFDVNQPEPIAHLLPPRFDVLDPTQMRANAGKTQFKVLLPDGKGGMAQVDQRVVRVEHEGERVSLVAMTPKQKSRRRLIQNIIAIIIGIAIMWIAFSMLT